jgi:hypothetical protein
MIYEGQRNDEGQPHGIGTEYYVISYGKRLCRRYEGVWLAGKREGKGTAYHVNGNRAYEGDWVAGAWVGNGNRAYEGCWVRCVLEHGLSSMKEGHEWREGVTCVREGKGISYHVNGKRMYEGDWVAGERHGKGASFYDNGNRWYEGDWIAGRREGKGTLYHENGTRQCEGGWVANQWQGTGTGTARNGETAFCITRKVSLSKLNPLTT